MTTNLADAGFLQRMWALEPIRTVVWPIMTAAIVLLLGKGIISDDDAAFYGVVLAVLVGGGSELARKQVRPMAKVARDVAQGVAEVQARADEAVDLVANMKAQAEQLQAQLENQLGAVPPDVVTKVQEIQRMASQLPGV